MTETPRLLLSHILVNQSQKEVTHNEALNRLDALVQAAVESADLADPPSSPAEGQAWIVAAPASGVWAGQEGRIAQWIGGAWAFHMPLDGMRAWLRDRRLFALYDQGVWVPGELRGDLLRIEGTAVVGAQRPAIADPAGGTTVDTEARTALAAILAALRGHGLIAS